jgi:AraC-like DNA-binding protein
VEIAFSAGFSEHSHLCRTFKRLTGLTPSEYRSNSRRG